MSRPLDLMSHIRRCGPRSGCNLLLDDDLVHWLPELVRDIRQHADAVYILQPKFFPLKRLPKLETLVALEFLYGNVHIDQSLQLAYGLADHCGRGEDILAVHPDGSVGYCSFDKPVARLERPDDLVDFVKDMRTPERVSRCPFSG